MTETIRTFKTKNFSVNVCAQEEHDLDLSWDDDGSIREGLERGEFVAFCVVVTVYCRGRRVGHDALGDCIYKSPREFMDHVGIKQKSPGAGSYFVDMVREACAEARKTLRGLGSVRVR